MTIQCQAPECGHPLQENADIAPPVPSTRWVQAPHQRLADRCVDRDAIITVCVWARHLDLKRIAPDHRVHVERVGDAFQDGGAQLHAVGRRRCAVRLYRPALGCFFDQRFLVDRTNVSGRVSSGGATVPRSGYSTG